jgi:hypothetical protein
MLKLKKAFAQFSDTLQKIEENPTGIHYIELETKDGKKVILTLEIELVKNPLILLKDEETA